jgi:hypothetical protein
VASLSNKLYARALKRSASVLESMPRPVKRTGKKSLIKDLGDGMAKIIGVRSDAAITAVSFAALLFSRSVLLELCTFILTQHTPAPDLQALPGLEIRHGIRNDEIKPCLS